MVTTTRKSIDDALFEARTVVNDYQLPYRNLDTTLLIYLNTALRAVYALRPDAYIGNTSSGIFGANLANTYVSSDLGMNPATPFPLDDRLFFAPVVSYIAARIELGDDEFTESARSAQLLQSFVQQLTGI